jgi:2,5-furandicarboxylate decarboxylase 1
MSDQSMRGLLAALEAAGDLHRVKRAVDPRFEIASVLSLRQDGPAQFFERVGNHAMPVVANRDARRLALALARPSRVGSDLAMRKGNGRANHRE